jgi:hypothetical protein
MQNGKLGRPLKLVPAVRDRIRQLTLADRRISNQAIVHILQQEGIDVCPASVSIARNEQGFEYGPPRRTFFLTDDQKRRRLEFARRELNRDWTNVLFTDESYFWIAEDSGYLWRIRGEHTPDVCVHEKKHPQKVLVFGGFCPQYQSNLVILLRGTVTGETYVQDLIQGSHLIEGMNNLFTPHHWTLMQDGASAHTCAETLRQLRPQIDILEDWPSGSPDLNPIENLWAIMKRRVQATDPQTIPDLVQVIRSVWEEISTPELIRLTGSMQRRLQGVIDANGGPNGY